ncbi:Aldo/keto reductase [Pluteus cervinus]|uniref:Aldo/keto reductase n=1 Tax=Pluteus cervinus TaxID=181527 RepID=A0ACD3BBR1_9AGAR|nr:Aldo/keto reductase [Pluteus cervinus]
MPSEQSEDQPVQGLPLSRLDGPLQLPAIVYGAGAFSNQYNTDDHLASQIPLRTIRLALRQARTPWLVLYGIRAFDTSTYYGPSEVILGGVLKSLEEEFPRSSYQLMTKCGRYGVNNFDYAPTTIRDGVMRSLSRLQTDYLDTVYLHDVEFVATPVLPRVSGNHATALTTEKREYGLIEGEEAEIRGDGDRKILDAYGELQKLQEEGIVKHIGITGYPLPTLLRLALLILHQPPYKPIDVILSYSHLSLQNTTFLDFAPHFYERAKVKQLVAASPLSMGLLRPNPPPWHPAPKGLLDAVHKARSGWPGDFPDLALGYAIRNTGAKHRNVPLVVGFSNPHEVHECMKVWRQVQEGFETAEREDGEDRAKEVFRQSGFLDWSWPSP